MSGPWEKYKKPAAQESGPWTKYQPAQSSAPEGPKTSAGEAALESFGNAATLGYLPHLQAMASKAMPDPSGGLDAKLAAQGFKVSQPQTSYGAERDANIARQALQKQEHPVASGIGTAAGLAATIVGTGGLGAVAKGASAGARFGAAAKTGAIMGGAANPGDVAGELSPLQIEQRAKNAAIGAGLGLAGQGVAEGVSKAGAPVAKWMSDKAAKKAARAVGRPTPTQAKVMAKSGEDIAMGRELLDKGAIPVLGTPARIAKRVDDLKEKSWAGVEQILAKGGDDAVVDGAEAGMKILQSEEIALLREAGETQTVKALEEAAEQLANMGSVTLQKAQRIKKTIDKQINYNKPIPDMTGGQAARFEKRTALRDQMDESVTRLGGEKNELKTAFKKHGLLEKASDLAEREAGREQANRAISLTDTIMGAAGVAKGEPVTGIALAAANKFGRTFGNSMQARAYDAAAKQLVKIPKYAEMAKSNPSGFAAAVERASSKLAGPAQLQPQFAESDSKASRAPAKGPDAWAAKGASKLGISGPELDKLMQSKQGKQLLIEASDMAPNSAALNRIKETIRGMNNGR